VPVEPAAGDGGEAVEVGDVVSGGGMLDDRWWDMECKSKRAGDYAVDGKSVVAL